mgnify:CR=1 FL=1
MFVTFEGYISEIGDDRFIMTHFDDKIRNVISNYNVDFVPLVGKNQVKVKSGYWKKLTNAHCFAEFISQFMGHNVSVTVAVRKNTFADKKSTSLSLLLKSIHATDPETTTTFSTQIN